MSDPAPPVWLVSRVFAPDEGGVQTYARQLSLAYAEQCREVSVFVKSSAGPRRIGHGPLRLVDVGPGRPWAVYARLLGSLVAASRTGSRPAMIHACTWRAALTALPFSAPLTVTVHGREIGRPRGLAFRLMRFVLGRATRIVAVSETTRALLLGRLPHLADRCVVAWNGTTPPRTVPRSTARLAVDRPTRILTLCRLVPRKNIAGAIRAAAEALRMGHHFHYAIAGHGEELPRLQALVDTLGVGEHVQLLGYVDDDHLDRLYADADIFLHPQIALEDGAEIEGFGIAVADAMARGLPCIVGRDGGPAEFVQDGETGLVVEGGSIAAITRALDRLLGDAALRLELGFSARRWAAAELSWRRHCRISLGVETA